MLCMVHACVHMYMCVCVCVCTSMHARAEVRGGPVVSRPMAVYLIILGLSLIQEFYVGAENSNSDPHVSTKSALAH